MPLETLLIQTRALGRVPPPLVLSHVYLRTPADWRENGRVFFAQSRPGTRNVVLSVYTISSISPSFLPREAACTALWVPDGGNSEGISSRKS